MEAWDHMCGWQLNDSSYYSCETVCPGEVMATGMHAGSHGARLHKGEVGSLEE